MLKGLTSTFKDCCNNVELTYKEYVKLENDIIPVKATLKDDCYENGNFIGTFILKEIQFETEATYEFRNKEFEYYKEVDGESIKIGTFISTDITINDTTEIVKVVGMDYGLKTQVEYTSALDYASGEITLKDVWDECCTLSGLESGISDFVNSDFIVDSDQFTGTGATIRDVFKGIAMSSGSFVKVMNDDKVYLIFNEFTSEKEELEIDGSASVSNVLKIDGLQEIDGNTTQSGTPTPSSPQPINVVSGRQEVSVVGKNLLPFPYGATTKEENGITWNVNEDGSITISGTATGISFFQLYDNKNQKLFTDTTKTYTLQIGQKNSNIILSCFDYINNSVSRIKNDETYAYKYGIAFTPTTNGTGNLFRLAVSNGVVINTTIYPMVVEGDYQTTLLDYEPYTGQSYEINLGKNLWNYELERAEYNSSGVKVSTNVWLVNATKIPVLPNTQYTISQREHPIQYRIICFNGTTYLSQSSSSQNTTTGLSSYTFTTPNNCNGIYIQFRSTIERIATGIYTVEVGDITQAQLEKGSIASSYSEYKTPIELCKIGTYQDRIYKSNGTWYIEKQVGKVVLNGSEDWTRLNASGSNKYRFRTNVSDIQQNVSSVGFSNYFTNNGDSWSNNGISGGGDSNIYIRYPDLFTQISDLTTWLSTHNTSVYYVLATPTTEEITDSELISQLNAIELLEGLNNISITSSDLTGKLKLTYYNNEFDIIEDYVELEDKRDTHPWTCLRLGMSNIEGENVDYIDEDLVAQYGENWLILNDNPFAYNQTKRQQLIMNIFNQIKAFGYSAFVSKVAFKPYLTSGDIIHFRNREKELVKSIVLRYTHSGEQITLEAPSETSATVNYIYPLGAIDIAKQTQIIVDKDSVRIDSLTSQTQTIQDDLRQNYYTSTQTDELVQTASTGLTNTFSEAGGNNIFRNTGLWFKTNDSSNPYEFWNGVVVKQKEEKASNMSAMLLQNGYVSQEQLVPNGSYTISFKYNKPIALTTAKVYINDTEYVLSATEDTEFIQVIEVNSQHINIRFNCDINNGCEIYDLMVNAGEVKLAYSQNQNETTTDTVNISKGITITASADEEVKFKADYDGIRTLDRYNNTKTKFTDTGMETDEAEIKYKANVVGVLWKEVSGQTWITKL